MVWLFVGIALIVFGIIGLAVQIHSIRNKTNMY